MIRAFASVFLFAAVLTSSAVAAERLVAIDVLLEPDQTMLAAADAWNARLREQIPEGFALDETHRPHITLVQTYVAEVDVDEVVAAVGRVAAELDVAALKMEAVGLYHIPSGEIGVAGIVIESTPELLAVQETVISALLPFFDAVVVTRGRLSPSDGTAFDPLLFAYVETFVPKQSGENFNPHVSTGVGPLAWLEAREAEPFDRFAVGVTGIAVYRLGNFATAAQKLAGF